jgi:hypothetical protein
MTARLIVGDAVRRAVLELNRHQREGTAGLSVGGNPHAFGRKGSTQTWGRPMLRIPEADFAELCKRNPAMASTDPMEFSAAMLEFERSDASRPYRVIEDYHGPRNPVRFGAG